MSSQETLHQYAEKLNKLKADFLFGPGVSDDNTCPMAVQFYLSALASIQQAEHSMQLAHLTQKQTDSLMGLMAKVEGE